MGFEICFDLQGISYEDFRNGIQKIFPEEVKQEDTRIPLPFPGSCGYIIITKSQYGVHDLQMYSSSLQSVRIAVYRFLTTLIDNMVPGPRVIIYDLYGYEDGALPRTSDPDYSIDMLKDFVYTKLVGDAMGKGSEMRFTAS